jgi:hypothetical protein
MKYISVFCAIALLLLGSCNISNRIPDVYVNEDVINYQDFSISAESYGLDSFITGTIFIRGNRDKPETQYAQICATLELDPDDIGGIILIFPAVWYVTVITSDYPQGYPEPEHEILAWRAYDSIYGWCARIEIGRRAGRWETGIQGGKGNILIELKQQPSYDTVPDHFEVFIGVGNRDDIFLYPANTTISIPFNTVTKTDIRAGE